ncbi:MAG: hypothetical protein JWQ99_2382 [Blastococcus sp.]|nr:hypothetical protein [Blastococcus sp.]
MRSRPALGPVLAATAALLVAFPSPALAKGGGGGGGGGGVVIDSAPCATINSWTPSVQTNTLGPLVVVDVGVFNGCAQERVDLQKTPLVAMTTTDTATGAFVSSSGIMSSYGQFTYRFYAGAPTATPPGRTLTLTVTKANGQQEDIRTTTLAALIQAALANQPVA